MIKIISWIIKDFWEDIVFIKNIITVKSKLNEKYIKELFNVPESFRTEWIGFLVMMAFFLGGFFVASAYYQVQCNMHITETFYQNETFIENYVSNINEYGINGFVRINKGEQFNYVESASMLNIT
jgi:hypothetical protein